MTAILYNANETDFTHLGFGPLNDAVSILVTEERNGIFELEMKYPVSGKLFNELKNDRLIKADAGHKLKDQRFKIIRITKPLDGIVTVYAEHVSYLTQDLALKPKVTFTGNARQALEHWKANLVDDNPFTVWSDISTTGKINWSIDEVENARRALGGVQGSILDVYGGEYLFDNYDIYLYQKRGVNSELLIAYGRNLVDLEQEEEIANTYTSIYPYSIYTDDDGNERMVTLPEYYIDSEHVDKYARRKILVVDFTTDEIETVSALRNAAIKYIEDNDIGVPRVNLKIKYLDLAKTLDYKDLALYEEVNLCDNVMIYFEKYDINTTAKVIKVVWDVLNERYDSIEVGEARASLSQAIDTVVDGKVQNVEKLAMQTLRTADGKNTIYFGLEEPLATEYDLKKNDIWYRIVDGEFTRTYRYDGAVWQLIIDMDSQQAKIEAQQAKDDAQSAVDRANQATQQATDAINQAQTAFDEAQNALSTAGNAYDIATTLQGDVTNLSTLVDEHTGQISSITQSVIGLQTQVSDIEGNVSTLTQTVSSLTTQISDIDGNVTTLQQTSVGLAGRLTDAEGNITTLTATVNGLQTTVTNVQGDVSSVTQLANALQVRMTNAEGDISTLTQTASSLQSTVSSLQDEFDNLEIGGRNLFRPSEVNNLAISGSASSGSIVQSSSYRGFYIPVKAGEVYTVSRKDVQAHNRFDITFSTEEPSSGVSVFGGVANRSGDKIEGVKVPSGANYLFLYLSNANEAIPEESIQLERGNIATDWTPAPEDMATQSQFTQLSNAINLRVMKDDVINQINLDTSGVLISGKKLILDGDTTVTGTFRVGNANITSLDAGKLTSGTLDAGKISVINLSANSIVGGILSSQNNNTTFNLNTGKLSMINADIMLGGGADIEFTHIGNRMYYRHYDPVGGITRSAGVGVGQSYNDRFPYAFLGTTNTSKPNPRDEENFTGFIAATNQRMISDGIGNSVVGNIFHVRNKSVAFDKGFLYDLSGSTIVFSPINTGLWTYDIGSSTNYFDRMYVTQIRSNLSEFDVRNTHATAQGFRMEVGYGGETHMAFYGLNAHNHYYSLGKSNRAFDYGYINQLRGDGYIGTSSNPYAGMYAGFFVERSDKRFKSEIKDNELGLDFINDLRTIDYKLTEQNIYKVGLIAQDLLQTLNKHDVAAEMQSIVDVGDVLGISYTQLTIPLIKAVQELDLKIESVKDDVEWLKLENQYLKQKVKQLEEMIA